MNKSVNKIPKFKNIKEEAEFWDKHDVGNFMDKLKVVKGVYMPTEESKTTMTIRLAPGLKQKIAKVASNYDISTSSLVRMWMVDRLRNFV